MSVIREKIDEMKRQIMVSLAAAPRTLEEITYLPCFKSTSALGVHLALEELVFERMVVAKNGRYWIPIPENKKHE
jgi:hypothetical protein